MHMGVHSVPATGHRASMLVPRSHRAPDARRDRLRRARWIRIVDAAYVLCIALSHLDSRCVDGHRLCACALRRVCAALADRQPDLIVAAPIVARAESLPREQLDERMVVERCTSLLHRRATEFLQ